MGGELPPQHHRSAPSQSEKMPNDQNRLPSIAELHSSLQTSPSAHIYPPTNTPSDPRRDPVLRQPLDGAIPSSTSLTGPPPEHQLSGTSSSALDSKLSSWTAINHSFQSPGLASSSGGHSEQLAHRQLPNISDQFATTNLRVQAPTFRPNSWPPPSAFKQESAIAGKPITGRRQDSAVSESTASPAFSGHPNPAFSSSDFSFRSPANHSDSSHPPFPRNALNFHQRPPSPTPSPVPGSTLVQSHSAQNLTQSTRYSRRRKSPPESRTKDTLSVITRRERAHSDSRVNSSYLSTTSHRGTLHDAPTDGNMPPPPHPPLTQQGSTSSSQILSNGGPSTTTAYRGSPYETRYEYPGASHGTPQDPSTVVFGKSIPSRCLHCHEVWTYPPPDVSSIHQSPSHSLIEMEQRMQAINDLLKQYNEQKDKSYQEWVQWHKVEPGHPDTVVPCMRGSAIPNNKRKSNVPVDDGQVSSKLRRLSFNTPSPRPSQHQLTPPPEPASTSPAASQSANVERSYAYAEMSSGDTVYVSDRVATILGLQGAPPAKYEKPADDSSNMWSDPLRGRKSASVEQQPSETAVSRPAGDSSEIEAGK